MQYTIFPIPAFNDNYIWLIIKPQQREVICIDPGDAAPVIDYLELNKLTIVQILITHHHFDHAGGIIELKTRYPDTVVTGPNDRRISLLDNHVKEGDRVAMEHFPFAFEVIETPGHTRTHICFYSSDLGALFSGDTLFSAGCGRLFEGSAAQMIHSLNKLRSLPNDTKVYCGHEYTLNNLKFAQTIEPTNQLIKDTLIKLSPNQLSLPSTLKMERAMNPFLRWDNEIVRNKAKSIDPTIMNDADIFRVIRRLKDEF